MSVCVCVCGEMASLIPAAASSPAGAPSRSKKRPASPGTGSGPAKKKKTTAPGGSQVTEGGPGGRRACAGASSLPPPPPLPRMLTAGRGGRYLRRARRESRLPRRGPSSLSVFPGSPGAGSLPGFPGSPSSSSSPVEAAELRGRTGRRVPLGRGGSVFPRPGLAVSFQALDPRVSGL